MKRVAEIIDIDGEVRENPDFPVAIIRRALTSEELEGDIVDPVFNMHVTKNLYGRIMTLIEATTEPSRLKAVKDVFSKELRAWENDVYSSARSFATKTTMPINNIYL